MLDAAVTLGIGLPGVVLQHIVAEVIWACLYLLHPVLSCQGYCCVVVVIAPFTSNCNS